MARKKPILKFSPPSRQVREAYRTVVREGLVERTFGILREQVVKNLPANSTIVLEASLEVEQAERLVADEIEGRLFQLYGAFSINPTAPGAGHDLARCLALEFVPGFNFLHLDKRGTPKRAIRDHKALAEEIQRMQQESKLTVREICRLLVKKPGAWKGKQSRELEANYYRFLEAQQNMQSYRKSIADRLSFRGTES